MRQCILGILLWVLWLATLTTASASKDRFKQWKNPFPVDQKQSSALLDSLTLDDALKLVAERNPALAALKYKVDAAQGQLKQAGLWPNPELEVEFEEVGWDAPWFSESEASALLSQEIELWGKRKNRKNLALSEIEATRSETAVAGFDIYAVTVERFYALAHAQKQVALAKEANLLAGAINESAKIRVEKGAALSTELLLAEVELERARLELAQSETELANVRDELASLWKSDGSEIVVVESDFDVAALLQISSLKLLVSGSRDVAALERKVGIVNAQLNLEKANGKPNLFLSGGYKRLEAEGSNTFVFGVGIPLPFFNRNQGNISILRARSEALKFAQEQALVNARAGFKLSSGV